MLNLVLISFSPVQSQAMGYKVGNFDGMLCDNCSLALLDMFRRVIRSAYEQQQNRQIG